MKLTNEEIMQLYNSLMAIQRDSSLSFPVPVSFAIVRDIRALVPLIEDITHTQQDLLTKYNAVPVSGRPNEFYFPDDIRDQALADCTALMNVENEVTLTKIKLKDIASMTLSVGLINSLFPIIDDGEE